MFVVVNSDCFFYDEVEDNNVVYKEVDIIYYVVEFEGFKV